MPARPPLRRSLVVAIFVTVAWAAASFAAAGVLSTVLDRDPVEADAAPFAGLVGLALAAVAVWLCVGFGARAPRPWLATVTAVASVYLIITVLALLVRFDLLVEQATSPFVITAAVLAGVAVTATWAVLRRYPPDAGLPAPDDRT